VNADRRLALALRAFPKRFRAARNDEILGTLAEVRAAGGGDDVDARELVDLVRAGWVERRRTRPQTWALFRYHWFDGRLDQRWHGWMFDDLRGWYPLRHCLRNLFGMTFLLMIYLWVKSAVSGSDSRSPFDYPDVVLYLVFLSGTNGLIEVFVHAQRNRTLRRHGYDASTWRPNEAVPISRPTSLSPRALSRAVPVLRGAALGLALAGPVAAVALFVPSSNATVEFGAPSIDRDTTYNDMVGLAMLVVACLLVASSLWWSGVLRRRFVTAQPWLLPDQQYRERSWWLTLVVAAFVIGAPGIVLSALPIAPMAVPAVYLAALGLVPELLVTARAVERLEAETGRSYWLSRSSQVESIAG
jgi:hypothetical protein